MSDFNVEFKPVGKSVRVSKGTTLLEATHMAGVPLDAPCGGNGTCGKCIVNIIEGDSPGQVQACRTEVHSNMVIALPQSGQHHILTGTEGPEFEIKPMIRQMTLDLSLNGSKGYRSEWQRIKEVCGLVDSPVNLNFTSTLADVLTSIKGKADAVLFNDNEILAVQSSIRRLCVMAFDLGTTTIVGWLHDANTGEELAVSSMLNPQSRYGADVIQRANYVLEKGSAPLAEAVRGALSSLIEEATHSAGLEPEDVFLTFVVGNTTMHHLLMGLSPASLVLAPYRPALTDPLVLDAKGYLRMHPNGKLMVLPNVAGFVGSDTVGVMLAAGFDRFDELTLAIDIGTNGELVLGDRRGITVCSTAAGPAFEGAKISSGMRGTTGAIDHIRIGRKKIRYSVIGGGTPKGICGSGLMDLMAGLLEQGVINTSGRFVEPEETAFADRIVEIDGKPAFKVADGVFFTQRDVREVQLAKAAMAAGIGCLLRKMGFQTDDIKHVMVAGAFGNYMYPASACRIGLIPPELESRVSMVGNAAGKGSQMAALNTDEWKRAAQLASMADYLDLARHPEFEDCFVDELAFPGEDE